MAGLDPAVQGHELILQSSVALDRRLKAAHGEEKNMFILGWIFFGAFIGWLSTLVMGKQSGGCLVNIALGLVGALAGGFLFKTLNGDFDYNQHGFIISTVVAVIGAIIVLALWNAVTGHRPLR